MASVEQLSKLGLVPLAMIREELAPLAKGLPLHARDGTIRAFATVDAEDHERLKGFRWKLANGYATRNVKLPTGGHTTAQLHREIMGLQPGDRRQVDHRDLKPLNCVRSNLRVCTQAQNGQNKRPEGLPGTSSQYRGVSWHKARRKWHAYAMLNGRLNSLGYHDTEEAAASAAREWRAKNMPFSTN